MNRTEYNDTVKAYSGRLYRYVLKFLGDESDAHDIVQDTYLKLWQHHDAVDYPKAKAWLFTTAYRALVNFAKRRSRMTSMDLQKHTHPSEENRYELREIIDKSLELLPPLQKSILLLRDLEGYNYKEIGEILDLNESKVKVYLFRARKKMKELMKDLTVIS